VYDAVASGDYYVYGGLGDKEDDGLKARPFASVPKGGILTIYAAREFFWRFQVCSSLGMDSRHLVIIVVDKLTCVFESVVKKE